MGIYDTFITAKKNKKRWVMLTAYDTPTAELLDACSVDIVLVGDSLGMVMLGYPSTTFVTMDEMIHHTKAVRRGVKKAYLIADMPLKGLEKGPRQALHSARRFMKEAGCDAVKLEWNKDALKTTDLLIKRNIPVMGHVGLTPQAVRGGSFRVQGEDAGSALKIFRMAGAFQDHGAFSVLLECIPSPVARVITQGLRVPTLGIGAGPFCDGQVLVFQDLVGTFKKFKPRFVKPYANLDPLMRRAIRKFAGEVTRGDFPEKKHSFFMRSDELQKFKTALLING